MTLEKIPRELISKVNHTFITGFEIPEEKLKPEANLFTDLKLDSLDIIDLLVFLEDHFGTKISGEKLKNVRSLGDVYRLVYAEETLRQTTATSSELKVHETNHSS